MIKMKMKMKTVNLISLAVLACGMYLLSLLPSSLVTDNPPSAPTAVALASYTPVSNGPTYSVGLPPGTTISSSSPGTIYFSLQAPSTYQWAGLGIGTQMAGATIFMMYPNGNGNVTISAREGGTGEVEPQFNSSLMAGVTLLEGSGITGGLMRANVKCAMRIPRSGKQRHANTKIGTTCSLDSSPTSTKSPWIAAYQPSGSLTSTDESLVLPMHNLDTMFQFTFDLTTATLSSDSNPFTSSGISSTSGSPSSSTTSSGSSSSTGSNLGGFGDVELLPTYEKAHGILMGTSILLLFPIGAVSMRVAGSPFLHGLVQVLSLCVLIVGCGLGVRMAHILDIVS